MSITRWTPHATTRIAAAGAVLVAMSVVSGAESAESSASVQPANATATYSCPFPSGAREIPVKIAGGFPASGTVGRAVQPGDVTVTPTLPAPALADLTRLHATSVTASARLSVTVAQHGGSTEASWSRFTSRPTPVPGSGALALTTTGAVPPATVTSVGGMAFLAGPLTLLLTPHQAGGAATNPATISLGCTLERGAPAVIATVPVPGPGGSATPRPGASTGTGTGTGTGKADRHAAERKAADDDPCILTEDLPPVPGEAYLAGFSNVNKQHGSALIGVENGQTTGHSTLELGYRVIIDLCSTNNSTHILSRAMLADENGEPRLPSKATFLTFDFMPATATLDLLQTPGTDLEIDSHSFTDDAGDFLEQSTVTSQLSIRIRDVSINGVPLDVGPHCESATPMDVTLTGFFPDYEVNSGGPLTGTATIPPFSGCGVGEDLDPLFTASISGPGNYLKLIQGVPCVRPPDSDPTGCDPIDRPIPRP